MGQLDDGDAAAAGGTPGDGDAVARWFRVDVLDGAVRELADALTGTGCLVVAEGNGLRVAVPGVTASEAETSLRFFLGSWRYGTSAVLRVPPQGLAL